MLLRTLGVFELLSTDGSGATRILSSGKALALLAFLARTPGRRASRDTLLELLWSDVDPERGRRTLRQTVWSLRQRLGETSLRSSGEDIILDLPLSNDADEFETHAKAGQLERAWEVYQGHFIPVFATPGGAAFEQWADTERLRLRSMWHTIGETLALAALAGNQAERCLSIARQLRQDDPERQEPWSLLIRAHLARNQPMQARLEAESASTLFARLGRPMDRSLDALIAKAQAVPAQPEVGGAPRRIDPDLVGRETPFATLVEAWQATTKGTGRTVVLRSPAGVGKTRLLRDIHARLTALDASPRLIRARPADRDLPYALAASLAEALGGQPGARGISPATAAALVDLAPALSNWFPVVQVPARHGDELLRIRTLALGELVEAVADERPLTILVDDLHWADEASRSIIASLGSRVADRPVLLVLATRPSTAPLDIPGTAQVLELEPLSRDQIEDLLTSIATAEGPLLSTLAEVLHAASDGVPLLVLAAIEFLLDQRRLQLGDGEWKCADPEALRSTLSHGSILEQVLHCLPAGASHVLLTLALAGRPLSAEVLNTVLGSTDGAVLAGMLEQRGLAVRVGPRWEVSHDRVAESSAALATSHHRTEVARRLGHALLAATNGEPQVLRHAGRLLAAVGDATAAMVFVRWLGTVNRPSLWRQPIAAAAEFLGNTPGLLQPRDLARHVTRRARLRGGWPTVYRAVQAVLMVALLGAGVIGARRAFGAPAARLEVVFPPLSNGFLFDTLSRGCGERRDCGRFDFPVTVTLRDARGEPTSRGPRSATIRLVSTEGAVFSADSSARFMGGVARFDSLHILGQGLVAIEVSAKGLPPVRSRLLALQAGDGVAPQLRLMSGTVAGQPLDSLRRTITVRPGQELTGSIRFWTVSIWQTASIIVGVIPFWGDRRSNFMALVTLPSHGLGPVEVPLHDANFVGLRLVAPTTPGRYRMLFTFDAETEMRFIASSTNWMLRDPVWNDGNDLVDLPDSVLAEMDRDGWTRSTVKLRGRQIDRPEERFTVDHWLPGTTLTVVVEK